MAAILARPQCIKMHVETAGCIIHRVVYVHDPQHKIVWENSIDNTDFLTLFFLVIHV